MHPLLFIHINKTGGSSVALALGMPMQMHATAVELRNLLPEKEWNEAFKFTFVRNPWDKVVSHYHYRLQTNQTNLADGRIDFNEWVKLAYGEKTPAYYDKPRYFMPQLDWITDDSGQILVDRVGRFENLEEDFKEICGIAGVSKELPHIRQSNRRNYKDYYAEDTSEIIGEWFKKDIEEFGYTY